MHWPAAVDRPVGVTPTRGTSPPHRVSALAAQLVAGSPLAVPAPSRKRTYATANFCAAAAILPRPVLVVMA